MNFFRQKQGQLPGPMLPKSAFRYEHKNCANARMHINLFQDNLNLFRVMWVVIYMCFLFSLNRHYSLRRPNLRHLIWPQSLRELAHPQRILKLSFLKLLLVSESQSPFSSWVFMLENCNAFVLKRGMNKWMPKISKSWCKTILCERYSPHLHRMVVYWYWSQLESMFH